MKVAMFILAVEF